MGKNMFNEVKRTIKITDVVARYGYQIDRNNKIHCPFHEGDNTASCSINAEKNTFHCFGCGAGGSVIDFVAIHDHITAKEAVEKLCREYGITTENKPKSKGKGRKDREHVYTDENGNILAKKTIFKYEDGSKQCYWNKYDRISGQYVRGGLKGLQIPLYHVERLKTADIVYIVEGEKDVETIEKMGYIATSSPNGAGQAWKNEFNRYLIGKKCVILTDNDNSGEKAGIKIAESLVKDGISCKLINATDIYKGIKQKGDITDIVEAVGAEKALELLRNAVNNTTDYIPTTLKEDKKDFNDFNQWDEIKPFESNPETFPFPLKALPPLLQEYLKAVSEYSAVSVEMGILPLLSVLSLCLQGKAFVNYPGNEHLEPLCLYTLTIAEPGERKTSVFKELLKPIEDFEHQYNQTHKKAINDYLIQKKFIENQLNRELNSKNGSLANAQKLQQDLENLIPVQNLKFCIKDITPEALARELENHGERMAIMGDEATILSILGGVYSKNGVNYDIILNCYDGSKYTLSRQTSKDITLLNPLLTISSMVQPKPFKEAMNNPDFSGKGLLQRFLFAFPPSKAGYQPFETPNIPQKLKDDYTRLITGLLRMKTADPPPIITSDKEAYLLFKDYHNTLQQKMRTGGIFENMKDYANKQLSKALRISALLHLTEHAPKEPINGQTALNAISISLWFEEQALKAFEFDSMSDTEKVARYICKRLQKSEQTSFKKRELLRHCRKYREEDITPALELLDEMNIINYRIEKQEKGRPIEYIDINPEIKNESF